MSFLRDKGIFAVLIVIMLLSLFLTLYFEMKKTPDSSISTDNYLELYGTIYPQPSGYSLGLSEAPVSLIVFFDPSFDQTALIERLKEIDSTYIQSGRAQLHIKPMVSAEDMKLHSERYIYAQQFACKGKSFPPSIETLYSLLRDDFDGISNADQTAVESYNDCLSTHNLEYLVYETENLGLFGIDARVYIGIGNNYDSIEGVPSMNRLERMVRIHEITVGT